MDILYIKVDFFLSEYPKDFKGERSTTTGKIINIESIDGNYFIYTLYTNSGSSSSPICNENYEVIGIHISGNELKNVNYEIFIGKIIDSLEN